MRDRGLTDLYQKIATEAVSKFPDSRVIHSHLVGALLRQKDYKSGMLSSSHSISIQSSNNPHNDNPIAFNAINEAIAKKPESVFTYEYLLSACEGSDPRVMNYVYYNAMEKVKDNAFLLMQYGEFLEEMSEYEAARSVFRKAYAVTPTDDIARSIVRVGLSKESIFLISYYTC